MIRIHNFPRGPRGLRVTWQCEEMGLPYEVELVSFPPSDTYRARHPLGSVPFLEDDANGIAISESIAMMFYLAHRYGPTPLLPAGDDPRLARALQMAEFGEATLGAGMNTLVAARFLAPEADKRNWSVCFQEDRVTKAFGFAADILGEADYLSGAALTLADISVVPALLMWQGTFGQTLPGKLPGYVERTTSRPTYQRAHARCSGK